MPLHRLPIALLLVLPGSLPGQAPGPTLLTPGDAPRACLAQEARPQGAGRKVRLTLTLGGEVRTPEGLTKPLPSQAFSFNFASRVSAARPATLDLEPLGLTTKSKDPEERTRTRRLAQAVRGPRAILEAWAAQDLDLGGPLARFKGELARVHVDLALTQEQDLAQPGGLPHRLDLRMDVTLEGRPGPRQEGTRTHVKTRTELF